jgi:hypothetical protein
MLNGTGGSLHACKLLAVLAGDDDVQFSNS